MKNFITSALILGIGTALFLKLKDEPKVKEFVEKYTGDGNHGNQKESEIDMDSIEEAGERSNETRKDDNGEHNDKQGEDENDESSGEIEFGSGKYVSKSSNIMFV